MKAMILAAGFGTRMRPLTDTCPKPLLLAGGKPLIVHHLDRLKAYGIDEVVINVSYRGEQIMEALGTGEAFGMTLHWSVEPTPLETAGGIIKALPMLGEAPFWLVNGDVYCTYPIDPCATLDSALAHLVMVDNPDHHPDGDFHLTETGDVLKHGQPMLTYSGIALMSPALFEGGPCEQPSRLAPYLVNAMAGGRVRGERFDGDWLDVGTPERLAELDARLSGIQ
ncbi:N-acetylmuramate alpha-1-phosphate uridylyltransferase MurU [Larsenimonas suaedae]|uniref:Nucleotidyltransferase family protein n=1 Tax=Larsenimonas suaedae TaxID=1851019 RepID=A0ABU1GUY5_9GAMM|nr:nucleotidyltransferase family protein [Larsenimonas suaedae]MCM2971834.1 nucleotidyltransferase family protein [Larsenimonas suaedae]MDR5895386.1 nucleotidyltransferase family protein [Larsenimonas suaedae]